MGGKAQRGGTARARAVPHTGETGAGVDLTTPTPAAEHAASGAAGGGREPRTLRALLASLIDYAGLFPPASMALADATRVYDGYLASNEAWMLGRFVIPATRLVELEGLLRSSTAGPRSPWRV